MVRVLQSLVVRLSSQAIQSESSKTRRPPRYGKRGKETLLLRAAPGPGAPRHRGKDALQWLGM